MLTLRLETGEYKYTAVCGDLRWEGDFTISREGCSKIYFTK